MDDDGTAFDDFDTGEIGVGVDETYDEELSDGVDEDEEEDSDEIRDDIECIEQRSTVASNEAQRRTTPYMTKYELARILGTRAMQIARNARVMVDPRGETDPLRLAEMELRARCIPITVRRNMPDGSYEDWNANELIALDDHFLLPHERQ